MDVSIIIVCMDRMDNLRPCLCGIRYHTTVSYEVLLVAYMFSEENMSALRSEFPWVKVVVSDSLRGFAENNNLALAQAEGRYCFVLNDDTYFEGPLIDRLVADFGRLDSRAAAVYPRILYPDGRLQTWGRRKLNMWTYMLHYLHLLQEPKPGKWTCKEGLFRTYNLNGACFLIRTDIFREAGFFDETYTFTPEDIALATMLNHRGYGVYCDADVSLTHIANATASRLEAAIKPTRVRGALIFYSRLAAGHLERSGGLLYHLAYFFLGLFVWTVEACRSVKYLFKDTSDCGGRNAIMAMTARNVRHAVFTHCRSGEIFERYYKGLTNL